MDTPTAFITAETLRTLAGQVMAVIIVVRIVKAALPDASTYWLRASAILSGITVHELAVWQRGMPAIDYALAGVNGMLVALTAMKCVEMLRQTDEGDGKAPEAEARAVPWPPVPAAPPPPAERNPGA